VTLAPGTKLGPYEIIAAIGAGGMGEVYRARDSRLSRDVAIKVLPAVLAGDAERLARFEREAKTVAALNHPNIVTLHSIEEANGMRFLTMELVEGQNLAALVVPAGLPLKRLLDLAIPMADALAAAHERGAVHRDLKPANVMVSREGRVKVLDFGLAKMATTDVAPDQTQAMTIEAPLSAVGQVMGTVPYMAPEQVRGEAVDARTDIFSMGILLYELATGRRPFAGPTQADVSSAILRDAPELVSATRADLPADIDRIIGRCLEKDPERRFQTAKDVRNELELVRRASESSGMSSRLVARTPAAEKETPSIAVLPFVNRSRDEEDEYFSDGLADELLSTLAKIRGLRVAARTSSFQFKGRNEGVAAIGQQLNVASVLEGTVRKSGNRVRISVQLVKVADGFHLWSETYDRTLDDIFAVQDDIAQSVVKELRTTLLGEDPDSRASGEVKAEVAAAAIGRGSDAEAHRLYMQARFHFARITTEDVKRALELLRQAVAIDPAHALAWAMLSSVETYAAITGSISHHEGIARARVAAGQALALAPELPEALLALGGVQLWYDFDFAAAERGFRRAYAVAPGNAEVLYHMAVALNIAGRLDEGVLHCARALELDPLNVRIHAQWGRIHRSLRQYDVAVEAFRKAIAIAPQAIALHMLLAGTLVLQGRLDDALAEARSEAEAWARHCGAAIVAHLMGDSAVSDRELEALVAFADTAAFQILLVHAVRGEIEQAFEWLEQCYRQRDSGILFIKMEPFLDGMRTDARWQPWLKKLGLEG
jgi:serine/threonine protein kinase/tetratricopeptide (TPR) repeat protein